MSTETKPEIRVVKTKIKLKKDDIRQCRLCLRILPRDEVRETRGDSSVDLSRKIEMAVSVRILKNDKLTKVCVNCLRLVDITYNFRMACMKTNIIFSGKLVMLHEGNWLSEEKKEVLDDCQELVRKHRMEMDKLFKCTGLEGGNLQWHTSLSKEEPKPVVEVKEDPVEQPLSDEIEDSEPEMTDEFTKMIETAIEKKQVKRSNPVDRYICEFCGQLVNKHKEEFHRNEHLNLTPYKCPNCPMAFHSKYALDRHKANQHDSVFTKECPVCHKMLRGKGFFKRHVAEHSNPEKYKIQCSICSKHYRPQYIKDHMNSHTGNMEHQCEVCGRNFAAKTNLFTHMKKYHANEVKTEVMDCGLDQSEGN